MKFNSDYQKRQSMRLKGHDYSKAGLYFITICTFESEQFFGEILEGEMRLNFAGKIANDEWYKLAERFENIKLHEFVVMPNHIHGIIEIKNNDTVRNNSNNIERNNDNYYSKISPQSNTLSILIRSYKSCVSRNIRTGVIYNTQRQQMPYFQWHRNYYDNIIRDDETHKKVSNYILNNPANWKEDKFFG